MPEQPPRPQPMSNTSRSRRAISCLTNKSDPLKDMTTEDRDQVLGLIGHLEEAEWATANQDKSATQDRKDALLQQFFDKREEAAKAKAAAKAQADGEAAEAETADTKLAAKVKKARDIALFNTLVDEHDAGWRNNAADCEHVFLATLRAEVDLIWKEKAALGYPTEAVVADDTYGGHGFR